MGLRARLTSVGRFPPALRADLEQEGAWLLEERLRGSYTRRHYREPGLRAALDKQRARVAVGATSDRIVVFTLLRTEIDLPPGDPRLVVTLDRPDRLCLAYDAETFHADRSGRVEVRFTTDRATSLADWLRRARH